MPTIVPALPRRVREIENLWIPMADGCRLAARIWLPEGAEAAPVPAVLEYLPYGKRHGTRLRDEEIHRYLAGHGYAALRVDVRGTGDSDGVLEDEYSEQELEDGVAVLAWIASQSWCTGSVALLGKSWGGFNALQLAARDPEPLGAVISVCASDDRYSDDAHYMGGCLLLENLFWGTVLMSVVTEPSDPILAGPRWRERWMARLEQVRHFPEIWMRHPWRDAYWRRGSVIEEAARVRCPLFVAGGWCDGYSNSVPRILERFTAPRQGLVGPWAHTYPHENGTAPAIGFLQETLAFLDRWLCGKETGAAPPFYRVWMPERLGPDPHTGAWPGRWIAEESWPSPRIQPWTLRLGRRGLHEQTTEQAEILHRSPQTVGLAAGAWCSFGEGELPGDQKEDDAGSLCFDSEPLDRRLEILGAPLVTLDLAVDRPRAFVAVRLNDLTPAGESLRITYGILNLAHRDDHEGPRPLVPGERLRVRVRLNDAAWSLGEGHRLRLAISTSYWPIVWPSPEPVGLRLFTRGSTLELPLRPPTARDREDPPIFRPPEVAPSGRVVGGDVDDLHRTITRDGSTGTVTVHSLWGSDTFGAPLVRRLEDIDLETAHSVQEVATIREDDPLTAHLAIRHEQLFRRGDWSARTTLETQLGADARRFHLRTELEAFVGEERCYERRFECELPRGAV